MRSQTKNIISDQKINKKYAKASSLLKNNSSKKLRKIKNTVEQLNFNIFPKEFEISFYLSELTKANYIELNHKLNINSNFKCGVKASQLVISENDNYICNIEFYIINNLDVNQYKNLQQLFINMENELKAFSNKNVKNNNQLSILNNLYNKILTQLPNIKTLYAKHVDELINLHTTMQQKFSFFAFNKDFNKNLLKTKKKLEDYTFSRVSLLKTYKFVRNQLNELLFKDNNIKIINYNQEKIQYCKIIFPENYVNINLEEFGGKKCEIEGNILKFPFVELETLNFPVQTDLIYNTICNDNIIFNINCKDKNLQSNFDSIEHVNYYPVVITDINRFKIIVSNNLLDVMKFNLRNIRLTLHFKNE